MQALLKVILWPLTLLYGGITSLRNALYDRGYKQVHQPAIPTVSVGNLTVGGTGKTPFVEYLLRLLKEQYQITVLSRGYGRQTKGYVAAQPLVTAQQIGDEPLQYYQKFAPDVQVVVCESRVVGALRLQQEYPATNLLVLDDAYQHRPIQPHVNILLNDYRRPFYQDAPFPGGRLRETRAGAKRADVVVVTKCPANISEGEQISIKKQIQRYVAHDTPIFFATVAYGDAITFAGEKKTLTGKALVITGIAQPAPFIDYLERTVTVEQVFSFKDHHDYTNDEVQEVIKCLKNDNFVVTTEKDFVKLKPLVKDTEWENRFLYIPIQMEFIGEDGRFDEWIKKRIISVNEQHSFNA